MSRKKGLSNRAYEPIPEGERYEPYTPTSESPLEFTIKAVVPGVLFSIVFGAANANVVPLMNDLTEVLDLESFLAEHGVEPLQSDFEVLYSTLATSGQHLELVQRLEQRAFDYFAGLRLPNEPTLYDHLVLSLRPKDLIATFNWDPFLWEAPCRNGAFAPMPQSLYLHGNVAIGYCTNHKPVTLGRRGKPCRRCGNPLDPSRLLYPVTEKNYTDDPGIAVSWQQVQNDLKDAFLLTTFGYGAPETDVRAVELMKQAWGRRNQGVLHDVEIIDVRDEDELVRSWRPFIKKDYFQVHSAFSESVASQYPRRSGEAMLAQKVDGKFAREDKAPLDATFPRLWEWYKPLIEQERSQAVPDERQEELGNRV